MRKELITATLIGALQFPVAAQAQVTFEMIMPTYGPNGQVTWPDGTVSSSAGTSTEGTLQMVGYTDTTPGTVNQDVGGVWGGTDTNKISNTTTSSTYPVPTGLAVFGGTDPNNAGYAYPTTTAANTSGAVWGGTATGTTTVTASPSVASTASTSSGGAVFGGTDSSKAATTSASSGAVWGGTSPFRSYTTTTGPSGETIYLFKE